MRALPLVALAVVWVVWGATYLGMRVVVAELPPAAAAGLRFLAAGLVMAVAAVALDRRHGRPALRPLLDYALVGTLLLAVGNGLVMWAERTIPSGIAALIVATLSVWFVLLDGLRPGGQPWTARVWAGTFLGLAGAAIIARPEGEVAADHWLAILALQGACVAWTVGSLYAQSVPRRLPLATAAATEMLVAGVLLVAASRILGEDLSAFGTASPRAWAGIAYLAVFGSLIGFTAFAYCLNELPASTVSTHAYVNPVVAVALGALVLGEPLTPGLLVGGTLIVVAVVLTVRKGKSG
jgi:drug/metabolite transporter (DMT)-like permease